MRGPRWSVAVPFGIVLWLALPAQAQNMDLMAGEDARGTNHTGHDHAGQMLTGVDLSPDPNTGDPSLLYEADFGGADLSLANLDGVLASQTLAPGGGVLRLDGANLSGSSAVGADLTGTTLYEADLTAADLSQADLTDVLASELLAPSGGKLVLDGAELSGSTWFGADLTGANLTFAEGNGADFDGAILIDATMPFADLTSASFIGADLTRLSANGADLVGADLTDATANASVFTSASLRDGFLVNADLSDADFTLGDLTRVDARCGDAVADPPVDPIDRDTCPKLDGTDFSFAILTDSFFQYGGFVDAGAGPVDLQDAELIRTDLSDACFTALNAGVCDPNAQMTPADLSGAALSGIRLDRAVLPGVGLPFAIGGCVPARPGDPDPSERCPSFVEADLSGTDLRQAQIFAAIMTGTRLHGADLTGAVLDGLQMPCDVPDVMGNAPSCLELFAQPPQMPGPLATLRGVGLIDADIAGVNFDGVDLTGANLSGADAYAVRTGIDSSQQTFQVDYLTTFRNATLVDAVLDSADLEQVDFDGADLTGADLTNAILTDAVIGMATATDAIFDRVLVTCPAAPAPCDTFQAIQGLSGARFVETNLTGQSLVALDLTNVDLTSAVLTDTDLTDAILTGVDFTSVLMTDVDLSTNVELVGATFDSTDLTCAMATPCDRFPAASDLSATSFVGANLTDVTLAGKMLTGVDFDSANLTDADLANTMASGADFTDATLSGTGFGGATLDDARFDGTSLGCAAPAGCEPFAGVVTLADASFRGVDLANATFSASPGPLDLTGADFSSADLSNVTFTNVDAIGARFDFVTAICTPAGECADFSGATLSDGTAAASFVRAELGDVSFAGKDLRRVDFTGARLTGADFTGADLSSADLSDTELVDADVTNAVMTGTDLSRGTFDGTTFALTGTTQTGPAGTTCTPGAGESPVDLVGAILVGSDFGAAINFFEGCILVDATTEYDGDTTVFPTGFTLEGQMTNVPEPAVGVAQGAALLTLAALSRVGRARRARRETR